MTKWAELQPRPEIRSSAGGWIICVEKLCPALLSNAWEGMGFAWM